jgi:hypothetical protein
MAETVDCCIMEVVQVATGVKLDIEDMAKERLRLPTRMKGGGVKKSDEQEISGLLGCTDGRATKAHRPEVEQRGDNAGSIYTQYI